MDEIILTRRFQLTSGGEVVLSFFKPTAWDADYKCSFKITWPDREKILHGAGVDEIQALLLAMQHAHLYLLTSSDWKSGKLSWLGDRSSGLGLPLPDSVTLKDFE